MSNRPVINLYTDGAASGNPGPGGYGVVLECAGLEKEISGGFALTTNNRMEMMAVIVGLEAVKWDGARVDVWSDSSYVVRTMTDGWKRKKNFDLWERLDRAVSRLQVSFHWIKGHNDHPYNERCDRLAVAAYSVRGLPEDTGYKKD